MYHTTVLECDVWPHIFVLTLVHTKHCGIITKLVYTNRNVHSSLVVFSVLNVSLVSLFTLIAMTMFFYF